MCSTFLVVIIGSLGHNRIFTAPFVPFNTGLLDEAGTTAISASQCIFMAGLHKLSCKLLCSFLLIYSGLPLLQIPG